MTSHTLPEEEFFKGVGVVTGAEEEPDEEELEPEPLSEAEMKKAMAGFHFEHHPGKTPLDFLRDPDTGITPGKQYEPSGVRQFDISTGIEGVDLPAAVFWEKGEWLIDIDFDDRPIRGVKPDDAYNLWVVTGNGFPGDWAYLVYKLPEDTQGPVGYQIPKHPVMWPKKYKEGKGSYGSFGSTAQKYQVNGYTSYWNQGSWQREQPAWKTDPKKETQAVIKAKSVTKAPSLPAGIRFRCPGCGHWFKELNLPGHSQVCAGADSSGYTDWAVMCDPECGCRTLDDVAACKPGFPRPKKKEVKMEEAEASVTATEAA